MNRSIYNSVRLTSLLVLLLQLSTAIGQPIASKSNLVSAIRVEVGADQVKVMYDVKRITASDSIYIQAESRSRGLLNVSTVTGDVGTAILPGKNKTIYWDYKLDGVKIDDEIQISILVKQPFTFGGGPTNALLSVLAPGVGTIFVQPNHKVGLRPLITGAYLGLIVYGLVRKSQSRQWYNLYSGQQYITDYREANWRHHHYLVASWAAVGLLLTDVTYTFLKGRQNQKQKQLASPQVALSYVGNTPTVGVQLNF